MVITRFLDVPLCVESTVGPPSLDRKSILTSVRAVLYRYAKPRGNLTLELIVIFSKEADRSIAKPYPYRRDGLNRSISGGVS